MMERLQRRQSLHSLSSDIGIFSGTKKIGEIGIESSQTETKLFSLSCVVHVISTIYKHGGKEKKKTIFNNFLFTHP